MVDDEPCKWRWYHHAILVIAVLVFGVVWNHVLRPSDRVANVVLVLCASAFVASFTVIQIRKRRRRKT